MKYILKKEYPGSPKLGNIIDNLENDWIENYPEFWEEVVEKDYEILSLVASERNPQHKKGSKFLHNKDYKFKNMHPTEFWDIYSVKRISDNKIFTIGDTVLEDLIIEKMFMSVDGNILTTYRPKHKQPLFTTEDGVDIYKGDIVWHTDISNFKTFSSIVEYEKPFEPIKGLFSTKEAAEEYILMNKPCLSLNDLKPWGDLLVNEIKKIVQSKIQQSV